MFLNNFYLDKFFDIWRSKKLFRVAVVDCSKHFLLTLQDILNPFMSFTFEKMQVIKISQMFPFLFIATELYLILSREKYILGRIGLYFRDFGERSGSVVECLTRDRRAAGSSLTGLCP